MMRVQVTLKSGAQIEFVVSEITRRQGGVTGQLTGLEWKNAESGGPALFSIDVNEIAAVVTTDISD